MNNNIQDKLFLLDKPLGLSSNQALQRVKRLCGAKKAGHVGSLDPLASGLLPILFGAATKFSHYMLAFDKTYQVEAKLGQQTKSGDLDGEFVATKPVPKLTAALIEQTLQQFRGPGKQVPSMFSALKYQGQPLYKLARLGIEVPRPARDITIYQLTCTAFTTDTLQLTVQCSKGTYIRTLVEDIAQALGTVAHTTKLRRTQVGGFEVAQAMTLDKLEALCAAKQPWSGQLAPLELGFTNLDLIRISGSQLNSLKCGQTIHIQTHDCAGLVRLQQQPCHTFVGLAEVRAQDQLKACRLVN